jgi:hypothetical protein
MAEPADVFAERVGLPPMRRPAPRALRPSGPTLRLRPVRSADSARWRELHELFTGIWLPAALVTESNEAKRA